MLPWPDSPVAHGKTASNMPCDGGLIRAKPGVAKGEVTEMTVKMREHQVHTETAEVGDEVRISSVSSSAMRLLPFMRGLMRCL